MGSDRKSGRGWSILVGLGSILLAVAFVTKSIVIGVIGVLLAIVAEKQKTKAANKRHAALSGQAVRPALGEVFENVDYQPDERLSELDINHMQLLLHVSYHYVDGSDRADASYHGVKFRLGNVRLMETDTYREEETNMERTTEKELWQGLMMTCKIGHAFPVGLAVTPRGKMDGMLRYADVKTENDVFDRLFTVKTDNPEAALLTLTPQMQEKILAAADANPGAFYVTFCQDGRISMAVCTGRNYFVPEKGRADDDTLRKGLAASLRAMLAIVDQAGPVPSATAAQEGGT